MFETNLYCIICYINEKMHLESHKQFCIWIAVEIWMHAIITTFVHYVHFLYT